MHMLRRDMAQMDLNLLEVRLKLRLGDVYRGSQLEAALKRLQKLHELVQAGQPMSSSRSWLQVEEDLKTLIDHVQQQQRLEHQLDVNIQKYEQMMFKRLAQLQSHTYSQ